MWITNYKVNITLHKLDLQVALMIQTIVTHVHLTMLILQYSHVLAASLVILRPPVPARVSKYKPLVIIVYKQVHIMIMLYLTTGVWSFLLFTRGLRGLRGLLYHIKPFGLTVA